MTNQLSTVKELAGIYRVSPSTILLWLKEGIITSAVSIKRGSRTTYRFDPLKVSAELEAYGK